MGVVGIRAVEVVDVVGRGMNSWTNCAKKPMWSSSSGEIGVVRD
jgi:hypothetical protein